MANWALSESATDWFSRFVWELECELGWEAHVVAVGARGEALRGDSGTRRAPVRNGVCERVLECHDLSLITRCVLVRDVVRDDLLALLDRVQRETQNVDGLDREPRRTLL